MTESTSRDSAAPVFPQDEPDSLARLLADLILLTAFAEAGVTVRACDLAAEAVLASDAFPPAADGSLIARPAWNGGS